MAGFTRRQLLQGSVAGLLAASTGKAWSQAKPDKLVLVCENSRAWKRTLLEEVAPAFEKTHGIKIEFTMLPVDAWRARLKAELSAGSTGIDLAMLSVQMSGWMAPHVLDHNEVVRKIMARDPAFAWDDFLNGGKVAGTYDGKLVGIPYRLTAQILHYQKALLQQAGFGWRSVFVCAAWDAMTARAGRVRQTNGKPGENATLRCCQGRLTRRNTRSRSGLRGSG